MEKDKNPRLRIGIDGRVLQEKYPSGIPRYALKTIEGILNIDKKNQYVIFYNSFKNIKNNIPKIKGTNVEEKIYRFPNKVLEWLWILFPYPKIDKILKVDIFFSPHFVRIPLSKKVKKVITIHDLSFEKNKRYFSFKKNFWHWLMNPKSSCRKSDKIIAVSESTKNDIAKLYGISKEKITVIHNGSEKSLAGINAKEEASLMEKYGLKKNCYFLMVSTIEPRKNIEGLIDSFITSKEFGNKKLVIAGKKGWLFKNIFIKVKSKKIDDKVLFTGFINDKDKETLLKNCSAFVLPSFYEGFGIPVIEAKRHSAPIITSSVSAIPEVIKDGAILVNPHIISDISRSISALGENDQLRRALVKKANLIKENSWEKTSSETLKYILN